MRDGVEARAARPKPGLWPMFFLAGVNLVDQIDTAIVRGVLPILEDEWGLSDLQLGSLGFVFVFVSAIATIPAGWLADNFRRTRIIGWTMTSWTALLALSATAVNYVHLLGARSVMGIGQAFDDPASTSLIGDYYPPSMRARVFSLQQVAIFVGGGIGLGLGGFVGDMFGWRWAFVVVGMPGSLLAIAAFRLREPVRGDVDRAAAGVQQLPTDSGVETTSAAAARPPLSTFLRTMARELKVELRFIFGIRTMRYILVGVSALLFTVAGIGYWLAVYHERFSGMSLTEATAFTAAVLAVGGTIGTFAAARCPTGCVLRMGPRRGSTSLSGRRADARSSSWSHSRSRRSHCGSAWSSSEWPQARLRCRACGRRCSTSSQPRQGAWGPRRSRSPRSSSAPRWRHRWSD